MKRLLKWVENVVKPKQVYFEGRFISQRKYISILAKRYSNMLKHIEPGAEYPTWE